MSIFEEFIENLHQFQEDIQNSDLEYRPDAEGYVDLECPNEDCLLEFKIHFDNASELFHRELIYCPRCRNKSKGDQYYPTSFIDKTRDELITHLRSALFEGKRMPKSLAPFESKEAWRQQIECEVCNTKYSVIGVAYFCPFCGHNSVDRSFADSMNKIQLKANFNIDTAKAISLGLTDDDIEQVVNSLKETCLTDCVTAFEAYCKFYFKKRSGNNPKRNVFQKVYDGSELWKKLTSKGYEDWISMSEMNLIIKLFQQRHLFVHNDGIVDQEYIDKSGDNSYEIGQRIVVNTLEIDKLTGILISLSNAIKSYCV